MPRPHIEHLVSAGGVVYRITDGRIQVILCGRADPKLWGLPKGTRDTGERLAATALREVEEETGLKVEIVDRIGSVHYWFSRPGGGVRYHKVVQHYLMVPVAGSIDLHDAEFDFVQWFDVEEAYKVLTYENDVEMVQKAVSLVESRMGLRQQEPSTLVEEKETKHAD